MSFSSLKSFFIFFRIHSRRQLGQLSFSFAFGKIAHFVILRSNFQKPKQQKSIFPRKHESMKKFFALPFRLYIGYCTDIILGGQNEFVINDPFGFMVQYSTRMKLDDLIVLDCQIMSSSFQMCYLRQKKSLSIAVSSRCLIQLPLALTAYCLPSTFSPSSWLPA